MKNKVFILMVFLCSSALYASSQISWNVKAGGNISKVTGIDANMKLGYQVGVGMDYFFTDQWGVQSSLMFVSKGFKADKFKNLLDHNGYLVLDYDVKPNRIYLELPVMLAYKMKIDNDIKLVLSGGGYVAYGIAGKYKLKIKNDPEISFKNESFGDGVPRFDTGLTAGAALELYGKYIVGITGDWGLKSTYYYDMKNQTYGLNIGYKF